MCMFSEIHLCFPSRLTENMRRLSEYSKYTQTNRSYEAKLKNKLCCQYSILVCSHQKMLYCYTFDHPWLQTVRNIHLNSFLPFSALKLVLVDKKGAKRPLFVDFMQYIPCFSERGARPVTNFLRNLSALSNWYSVYTSAIAFIVSMQFTLYHFCLNTLLCWTLCCI